jgi:hypothetical protein
MTSNPVKYTTYLDLSPEARDRVTEALAAFEFVLPRVFAKIWRNISIEFSSEQQFWGRLRTMCVAEGLRWEDQLSATAYFDYEYEIIRIRQELIECRDIAWLVRVFAHEFTHAWVWLSLSTEERKKLTEFLGSEKYDWATDPEEELAYRIERLALSHLRRKLNV